PFIKVKNPFNHKVNRIFYFISFEDYFFCISLNADSNTYNKITSGNPKIWKTKSRMIAKIKNTICNLYLAKLKFLIFRENNGSSAFKIKALKTEIPIKIHTFDNISTTKF